MHHDSDSPQPGPRPADGAPAGTPPCGAVLALTRGVYYLPAGIWPLVSIGTFQRVTGPKVDLWLVKTAGVLITAIGVVLTRAGARRQIPVDIPLLAVGSAVGLTGIDVVYVARRRIAPIYLLDAAAEVALLLCWAALWLRGRGAPDPRP